MKCSWKFNYLWINYLTWLNCQLFLKIHKIWWNFNYLWLKTQFKLKIKLFEVEKSWNTVEINSTIYKFLLKIQLFVQKSYLLWLKIQLFFKNQIFFENLLKLMYYMVKNSFFLKLYSATIVAQTLNESW